MLCNILRRRLDVLLDSDCLRRARTIWIRHKTSVGDNYGNYESRSYLGCLLTGFEKVDCSVTSYWPSSVFQDGDHEAEYE